LFFNNRTLFFSYFEPMDLRGCRVVGAVVPAVIPAVGGDAPERGLPRPRPNPLESAVGGPAAMRCMTTLLRFAWGRSGPTVWGLPPPLLLRL